MKKIYFVRHGQTYMNVYQRVQGWIDSPLTESGMRDAEMVAKRLQKVPLIAAWSSDTIRAIKTRNAIVSKNINQGNISVKTSSAFREQFFGYMEGMDEPQMWRIIAHHFGFKDQDEMIAKKVSFDKIRDISHKLDPYHQAEDSGMFWERISQGIGDIQRCKQEGNYLVVSHGLTIRSLVEKYAPNKFNLTIPPRNGSISIMTMDDKGNISFESYNQ
ncbi:histidine phosphatase family protein [Lactobacillus porci]|uniref:histidine phosphatase family protein n=1 Tax=Lactobacillus porci TaxID=2012477 RepID=UPI003991798A